MQENAQNLWAVRVLLLSWEWFSKNYASKKSKLPNVLVDFVTEPIHNSNHTLDCVCYR